MIEYKDLEKVNKNLCSMAIKGKDYIQVNERVKGFRALEPNGSITTEIVSLVDGVVTMKATVCDCMGHTLATGYAQEKEGSSYINNTSFIENCETSAVGRALGFLGIGIDVSIASVEEVKNAQRQQEQKPAAAEVRAVKALIKSLNVDATKLLSQYKQESFETMPYPIYLSIVKKLDAERDKREKGMGDVMQPA